jgi:hypothetical protein
MSVSSSEAQARITVNKLLEEAGWRFLPDTQGRRENIICEHRVTPVSTDHCHGSQRLNGSR